MEERTCLDCGKAITVGRSDKKFCDDSCRTNYNNRQKEQQRPPDTEIPVFIGEINHIILTNWRILKDCLGTKDSVRMRPLDLSGRGFNFKFYTSERFNQYNDDVYNFCYDMGYKIVGEGDERRVVIIKNSEMIRLSGPAFPAPKTDSLG